METSRTLLKRIQHGNEGDVWNRFLSIYSPLIESWLRRNTIETHDIGDLMQEVLMSLAVELPRFEHNGRVGAFRNWLRQITLNRCRRHWKAKKRQTALGANAAQDMLDELEDPDSELSRAWDEDHDRHVLNELLTSVQKDFSQQTVSIFTRTSLQGISPKDVAVEFGVKVGQVYKAKFRVMARLQHEANRLYDSVCVEVSMGTAK